MRRKTDVNGKDFRPLHPPDSFQNSSARHGAHNADHMEAVSMISVTKKVTRFFTANFGTRFDKLEHEINRDKRFLVFEAKQTPFYTGFFERVIAELEGDAAPAGMSQSQLSAQAPTKGAQVGSKKDPLKMPKSGLKTVDATPRPEEDGSASPTNLKQRRKPGLDMGNEAMRKSLAVNEKTKARPDPATQVTSRNFKSIKTEDPPTEKQFASNVRGKDTQPEGYIFKPKDPVPVFRPQPKPPTLSTPKGSDEPEVKGFRKQKDDSSLTYKEEDLPFRHRKSMVLASDTKERAKRRPTETALYDKPYSNFSKVPEDISENDAESDKDDGPALLKKKTFKNVNEPGKNQMHDNPLKKNLHLPINDFALTSDQLDAKTRKSRPKEEEARLSNRQYAKADDMRKTIAITSSIKKSVTSVGMNSHFKFGKKSEDNDSVEDMLYDPSEGLPLAELSKKPSLSKTTDVQLDLSKVPSPNSLTEVQGQDSGRVLTPRKSLTKRLRSADKDRMVPEIKAIMRSIVDKAVLVVEEMELRELHQINEAEEHMRQEAKRAEKKIKKEIRQNLKSKIYELMLQSMPEGSRLPSMFLASQRSESSLLIESVKKGVEKAIQTIETDIKGIYSQYEELRRLTPEEIHRVFPFEISNLSYFTLKTVPENELKDALTTDRLSADMLSVFRLFYYIHFEGASFLTIDKMNQKTLMGEIADLYQNRLKHIEAGDKPLYRELSFQEKLKMEDFLTSNRSLFSVISDMSLRPFSHSVCFYTFEILFYYGMKNYVKFMEKPREKDKNMRNSAYQLLFLLQKTEMLEGNMREFGALQRQFDMK